MGTKTLNEYDQIIDECKSIYLNKIMDYGTSWRVLRPGSITDQIFIKAKRIKTIEEKREQKVGDSIEEEFMGIINYSLIALIQIRISETTSQLTDEKAKEYYDENAKETRQLMIDKNHDYGEAWRDMRPTSFTDMILMKLLRLKQIESNNGQTLISEGSDSHYRDIINYSIFALIKLKEEN